VTLNIHTRALAFENVRRRIHVYLTCTKRTRALAFENLYLCTMGTNSQNLYKFSEFVQILRICTYGVHILRICTILGHWLLRICTCAPYGAPCCRYACAGASYLPRQSHFQQTQQCHWPPALRAPPACANEHRRRRPTRFFFFDQVSGVVHLLCVKSLY